MIRKRERTDVSGKSTGKSGDGQRDADTVCACARMPNKFPTQKDREDLLPLFKTQAKA